MALSSLSVRRPVTTLMFYAGVVLVGIAGFRHLAVDFLPPVSIPRLAIYTTCPGYSPEEMDERVAQPLAAIAGTVAHVKRTSSLCRHGMAVIMLEFPWGVNMDYARLEVREKLDQFGPDLPPEAGRPGILKVDPAAEPVMTIGVTPASARTEPDPEDLVTLTEACHALLKKRLEQVEGVAQVLVLGGVEREIRIHVDQDRLLALGLSIDEVVQAVGMENAAVPGGSIRSGALRYPLRLLGTLTSADEIAQLSFTSARSWRKVRLAEIASVHDTVREREGWTRFNGKEILVLQIRKEAESNTLTVSENLRHALERLELENPGLRLILLNDQAEFIQASVADVEQSILWGALLAFLVLFLFLNEFTDPLIVGATMSVSILATLVTMNVLGISLNIISLTGLALGIGMLGDNAIIVVENVRRLHEEGIPLREAVVTGSREINLAVTASTMTNVAVFLPVLFVRSVAQQLFVDMAVTMTISLLASLLVAVTLVPVLLSWRPRIPHPRTLTGTVQTRAWQRTVSDVTERMEASTKRSLEKLLGRVHRTRGWLVISTATLLALSVWSSTLIRSEPAPEIDRKRFIIDVTMRPGTSVSTVARLAGQMENSLRGIPGVGGVYAAGGIAANPEIWSLPEISPGHLYMEVMVTGEKETAPVMERAREQVQTICRQLAGVDYVVRPAATTFERILRPQAKDLVIFIQGDDPGINDRIAGEFVRRVTSLPGLVDLSSPINYGAPEYQLTIDRVAAESYGVTGREIAEHISRQTGAVEAAVLSDVDHRTSVRVQAGDGESQRMEGLLSSSIQCGGTSVRLNQLVESHQAVGRTEIRREDGTHTVALTANAVGRSIGAVAADLRRSAASCALPAGYRITIGGENEEMESSFRSLALVIALSLLLVYMILAAEYESLLYPFVILLTSPLAFIGATLAMLLAGEKYNIMSLVGIVIMIGAVDNDAVIAVDVITVLRRSGLGLREAIRQGMSLRLRPILMTTATTLLGLLPLTFSLGRGSELVRALTIPLAGGLVSSTLFTLVVIPAVYSYIDSWTLRKR